MFNFFKKKEVSISLSTQEVFLLERYSSVEYYESLVNSWDEMIDFVESLLKKFVLSLPNNYRDRTQSNQPDIVWGDRVIPNFKFTLEDLKDGLIAVRSGNILGLQKSANVISDLKGVSDFSTSWMNEVQVDGEEIYYVLLHKTANFAKNINLAVDWNSCVIYGALRNDLQNPVISYQHSVYDWPLPDSFPEYRLNYGVQIKTGEPILQTGVYRSIEPFSTCKLLIQEVNKFEDIEGDWVTAPQVYALTKEVNYYPDKGDKNEDPYDYLKELNTTWILVEKVMDDLSNRALS